PRSLDAVVDIREAACLFSIAPDLDVVAARQFGLGNLPANGGRGLLPPTFERAERAVHVVVPRDACREAEVLGEVSTHPLAKELLPPVTVFRHRGVSIFFPQRQRISSDLLFRSVDTR